MHESKRLTRRQHALLEDLFTGELDEQAVLDKHAVTHHLYEHWLADERFAAQFEQRIAHAYRQSRMILARNAPAAATKLAELAGSKKEETARKACLDIISSYQPVMAPTPPRAPSPQGSPAPDLSPESASRLLAILADQCHS